MPFDYTSLPGMYRPRMDDEGKRIPGIKIALLMATPLDRLPRGLRPRHGFHLQPPMFHYGWILPYGHIQRVGRKHDFLVLELDPEASDDEFGELDEFERNLPNYEDTLEKLAPMLQARGVSTCKLEAIVVRHDPPIAISLTTNYVAGNLTPPEEEIAIIQNFLEFDSPPKWLLNGAKGQWRYQTMKYVKKGAVFFAMCSIVPVNPYFLQANFARCSIIYYPLSLFRIKCTLPSPCIYDPRSYT
ncbi:hypothetical protein BD779DRAFT_1804769, partial [Infundibulicybe gibba]